MDIAISTNSAPKVYSLRAENTTFQHGEGRAVGDDRSGSFLRWRTTSTDTMAAAGVADEVGETFLGLLNNRFATNAALRARSAR